MKQSKAGRGSWIIKEVKKKWHTLWRLSAASGAINQATASGRRPQTKVKSKAMPQLESNFSFNVTSLVFEKQHQQQELRVSTGAAATATTAITMAQQMRQQQQPQQREILEESAKSKTRCELLMPHR